MDSIMLRARKDHEIFNSIINSIVIPMMNNLRQKQWAANIFFHDVPMFPDVSIVNPEINVSLPNNASPTFCFFRIRHSVISASIGTVFGFISTVFFYGKYFFANKASPLKCWVPFSHE